MNATKIHLHVGLEKPVQIAHLTDIHLCLADERDPHLIEHAKLRGNIFYKEADCIEKTPSQCFEDGMQYGETNCDLTVITGDILDYISQANLEESDRILQNRDYLFTAGNHEFCPQVGIPDSHARRGDIYYDIQAHFKGNMYFESRVIGGLNVVTVDNSYYNYSALQVKALRQEIEKGLPIVLFSHCPLTEPMLNLEYFHKDLVPDKYMQTQTKAMLELIASTPLIKASFTGHWHVRKEDSFRGVLPEYVAPGCFKDELNHIIID